MKPNYTHIAVLLDSSGSMGSCYRDTIDGFNKFLADQKTAAGTATMSMVQFNNQTITTVEFANIQSVSPLDHSNYRVGGGTALVDAMVTTIDQVGRRLAAMNESDRPSKVIFLTLTDGEENASRQYGNTDLKQRIETQQKQFSWEFVYLGANQDAIAMSKQYGYAATNVMSFAQNPQGIAASYTSASSNLRSLRAGTKADMSFTDADKDLQTVAGVDPALNPKTAIAQP